MANIARERPTRVDGDEKLEELKRRLAENSPEVEFLREFRDLVRVEMFGLEPLCEDCEEGDSGDESEPRKDN